MLYPAQLYREELKRRLVSCWYKPKYDYYFLGEYREFDVPDNTMWRRDFVHLNDRGEVDGYFSYHYDPVSKSISQFGLISFTDKGAFLTLSVLVHIKQLIKEGLHRIEWWAVEGNPVNELYKKLVAKYGGKVVGELHDCNYVHGKYCGSVIYEIILN